MRDGGSGVRALSQILLQESLSYSLKHISTGEHSLHILRVNTHPHIYVLMPYSDPVILAAVGSFSVQRATLVQFWIGAMGRIGGFRASWKEWPLIWHTVPSLLPFLEIKCIWYSTTVSFVMSNYPSISFELGDEIIEIYILFENEWPACYAYHQH